MAKSFKEILDEVLGENPGELSREAADQAVARARQIGMDTSTYRKVVMEISSHDQFAVHPDVIAARYIQKPPDDLSSILKCITLDF